MKYRSDIDGLRAISILAVVAFHVGVPYVHGGYIGVDVFFVISGFLITKLLLEEKARTGGIDLIGFWARRVRRILPSLLFVIAATLLIGVFVLERVSGEVGTLAKAAIAALLMNANHYFLAVTGDYFGAAAEMNPLLHLWTLSVEEQFYLIWPLLLLLVANRTQVLRKGLILAIAIASFIGCAVLTSIERDLAFFVMPTRAWEFMVGAGLAVLHIRGLRENKPLGLLIATLGAFLLIYSVFFLSDVSAFPGVLALLPVAGGALTILAGTIWRDNPIAAVLNMPFLTYIGRISYVWYLWHWPILVLTRSMDLYERHLSHDLLAALLSFLLAVLTHHYIETPLRRYGVDRTSWNAKRILLWGISATVVICMLSVVIGVWARYGWFYSDNERHLDNARKDLPSLSCLFTDGAQAENYKKCLEINVHSNGAVLLWGDSHANHWSPAFISAAKNQAVTLVNLSRRGCIPILGDMPDRECMQFNNYVLSQLGELKRNGLRGVILSARWPEYVGGKSLFVGESNKALYSNAVFESQFENIVHKLEQMNLRVLIVLPSPSLKFAAVHCLARKPSNECGIDQMAFNEFADDSISVLKRVAGKSRNSRLLDPQTFMCENGFCSAIQHGVIAYTDNDHLSKSFVENLSSHFDKEIVWLLDRKPK